LWGRFPADTSSSGDLDFRRAVVSSNEILLGDFNFGSLDGFLWFSHISKGSDGHDMLVLESIERLCPVINCTFGLKVGLDKFKTSSFLKAAGIPVPDFALIPRSDDEKANAILSRWGEALVKPRFGGFGIGIFRAKNPDDFIDLMDYSGQDTFYVERFYENDFGDWCGINVVGGEVIYGYGKKESKIVGWKVLDRKSAGGEMILRKPSPEQEEIALKVADKTGLDFFGVDMIKTRDGENLVVDLNTFPGIYPDMLSAAGVDVGLCFAEMVSRRLG